MIIIVIVIVIIMIIIIVCLLPFREMKIAYDRNRSY